MYGFYDLKDFTSSKSWYTVCMYSYSAYVRMYTFTRVKKIFPVCIYEIRKVLIILAHLGHKCVAYYFLRLMKRNKGFHKLVRIRKLEEKNKYENYIAIDTLLLFCS